MESGSIDVEVAVKFGAEFFEVSAELFELDVLGECDDHVHGEEWCAGVW